MSEVFVGVALFGITNVGVASFGSTNVGRAINVGRALYKLFQQAGVPFESSLLSKAPNFCVSSLLTDWHQQLSHELSLSRQSLPLKETPTLMPLAQARALDSAITKLPLLHHIVQHTHSSSLHQARTSLQQAEQARLQGNTKMAQHHALTAKQLLEEAVFNAHERLAKAQQSVLSDAVADSLKDLGYQVQLHQSEQGTALWGSKGGQGIAVVIGKDGSLQMDTLGFDGLSCRAERERLLAKLAEKGITIQQKTSVVHGRKGGGQLLEGALRLARQRRLSIPHALLETALPKSSSHDLLRQRQWLVWGQKIRF